MSNTIYKMPDYQRIGMPWSSNSLRYERDKNANIGGYIDLAEDYTRQMEEAGDRVQGRGSWAEPMAEEAIGKALNSPGMSAGEYAQAKGRVTGSFRAATGALAQGGGKRGYFSKGSTAQAAGNAPAAALGGGLADLEAKNAEIQRKERASGLGALTSLAPGMMDEARRPGEALGSMVGSYMASTPLNMTGIGTGYINQGPNARRRF